MNSEIYVYYLKLLNKFFYNVNKHSPYLHDINAKIIDFKVLTKNGLSSANEINELSDYEIMRVYYYDDGWKENIKILDLMKIVVRLDKLKKLLK